MAAGKSADKTWKLHDELGGGQHANDVLFTALVKFLQGHVLDSFVEDFRRHYEMPDTKLNEEDDDFFSDREANPHDGSMYGDPEDESDEDDESAEYCAPV